MTASGSARATCRPAPTRKTDRSLPRLRTQQAIIHGRRVVGRGQALEDVTFWYFRPGPGGPADREFTHRIDAERAELTPGFWQLTGVVENRLGGEIQRSRDARPAHQSQQRHPAVALCLVEDHSVLGTSRLHRGRPAAGMEVGDYVLKYHTLLATPVFMLAMALIGAVVCLRLARSGGLSRLIGAGALAGFVLFFVTRLAAGMSASGRDPARSGGLVPAPVRAVRGADPARACRGRLKPRLSDDFRTPVASGPRCVRDVPNASRLPLRPPAHCVSV